MGTVVPFRRGDPRPDKATAQASRSQAAERAKAVMKTAGLGVLGVLRYAVFLVLLTLRRPLRALLGLGTAGGMLALAMIALGFTGHGKSELLWAAGLGTAACVAVSWFYDVLLLRLSPQPIILT
ncbi:MAG: hypothetical protein PHT60_15385 [Acidiphilium sp.]|nr:hypothetical protein [Acidiphilium sp.]MDD4937145.1 hypothetical protein [Acidiphilium sp.]